MARRSRNAIAAEVSQLESVIRGHPEGISLRAIMREFETEGTNPLSERTMLRRLHALEVQKRIWSQGNTTAARYIAHPEASAETNDSVGESNPIRFRYRSQLAKAVRKRVLSGKRPKLGALRRWAEAQSIPPDDREAFAEIALELLLSLNEGSISLYGLRQSDFQSWKARLASKT